MKSPLKVFQPIPTVMPTSAQVQTFSPNIQGVSPVTGSANPQGQVPDISPDDYLNSFKTEEDGDGLIKSRNKESFENRINSAIKTHGIDSAKVSRLNRRYASFKTGSERRAEAINEINPKTGVPRTGIGRIINSAFGSKNQFTGDDGTTKMSRRQKVNETASQFLKQKKKDYAASLLPPVTPPPTTPIVGNSGSSPTTSTLSSQVIAAGSQGKKCTGKRVLNTATGKCE